MTIDHLHDKLEYTCPGGDVDLLTHAPWVKEVQYLRDLYQTFPKHPNGLDLLPPTALIYM